VSAPGIAQLLAGKRVCICAGSGGVGKTTTAAAIATGMAARGSRVAVLTIDPAKRLADSLGLEELGNEPHRVDPERFAAAGLDPGAGELWAMMLDAKATFDEVIRRNAPDAETRDRILRNRIYQQLSTALAGSQEYMAMERLYELWTEDRYDLLVLDTPPSRNALDFLDAPRRLIQFIEGRALQVFVRPTGLATRLVGGGASMMFSILRRITGVDLLDDLAEFFQAFSGMVGGFRDRARKVNELLADERTGFVIVCAPQAGSVAEAAHFHRQLTALELPFSGVVVNRVHVVAGGADGEELVDELAATLDDRDLAGRVAVSYADLRVLAARDELNIRRLVGELGTEAVVRVPYLDEDVHDLTGLAEVNRHLFGAEAAMPAATAVERAP
jgi:anion-transporting  ArsA/GET3 family ATPase